MKQPRRGRAPKKHVILFLAADPLETDRIALAREARAIQFELKRSGYRERFEFVTWWAAEPLDLLRALREWTPTIVHFSGHGAGPTRSGRELHRRDVVADVVTGDGALGGVVFTGADGRGQVVTPAAFGEALAVAGAQVRVVVLNACFTVPMAQALTVHVDCVVGMMGSIHDDVARIFSIGFYGGLGEQVSMAAAFAHGRAAINLEGLADVDQPRLVVRDGFDAATLVLAAVEPPTLVDVPCPYPGMRPFTADDADCFHGRDGEITELIGRVRAGEREVFVIGPSGSGKSSLVTAGVLPRLARGVSGLGPCVVRELRPGEQPVARLAEVLEVPEGGALVVHDRVAALLAHRAAETWLLVVVDQLEELFTLAGAVERAAFLAALRALRAERRCAVVLTLRADFFGALMESDLWAERRGKLSRIEVSPLRGEALCEAIAAPARAVGVTVDPDLVVRLVADAASEPGILPLLQETMVQLWDTRSDQTLTLADYQALGDEERSGLSIALARRAEATLRRLSTEQTNIARRILLRLISFGEGRSDTRRQQSRAQLRSAGDDAEELAFVLRAMIEDRLLTVDDGVAGEPRVDLSHEALITAWPELRRWVHERRTDEQRRRQLEAKVSEWIERGRGAARLLDAGEVAEASKWRASDAAHELGEPAELGELVIASQRELEQRSRRRRQRTQRTVAALAVGLMVVSTLGIVAWVQAREVHRRLADSYQEQGRALLIDQVPSQHMRALPYLVAAREERERAGDDVDSALRMLFAHVALHVRVAHHGAVLVVAFSPDGTRVVTASEDQTARVWDARTGEPITNPLAHHGAVLGAAFSPDGALVVTASRDQTARVWDARTGKPVSEPLAHRDPVLGAAFSPDGARVVTASRNDSRVWDARTGKPVSECLELRSEVATAAFSLDGALVVTTSHYGKAQLWDAHTGNPVTESLESHWIVAAAFIPDGARMVTKNWYGIAQVWDVRTDKPVSGPLVHQADVVAAAFSPDGARVVTASEDKTARIWEVRTGNAVTGPLAHQDTIYAATFSPDGARVVTASKDKTARIWEVRTGKQVGESLSHQGAVMAAVFSLDGARVATASKDQTARVWEVRTGKPVGESLAHRRAVVAAAFSPDGAWVVTASKDQTARVWDARTGKPVSEPLAHQDPVLAAVFSPDSSRVVTASEDQTARVWDARTGEPVTGPLAHQAAVLAAAFSPDGARVVTASEDQTARVWDARTGKAVTEPLAHQGAVVGAAFSPDGALVVTASRDQTARVWDARTGKPVSEPLAHQDWVYAAAFSQDSARVVTASRDQTARVWDARTGIPRTEPLAHQGSVYAAAFSPDGARVVTASEDQTARVWDARAGKPVSEPLAHHGAVLAAAFSPDGARVVTASKDQTARVWDARTGKPVTEPLAHQSDVVAAVFSPDGGRVVTASHDGTARVWELPMDPGSLDDWRRRARCGPFSLDGGVLVDNHSACP